MPGHSRYEWHSSRSSATMTPIARRTSTSLILLLALLLPASRAFIGQLPRTCLQAVEYRRAQRTTATFMNSVSADPAADQEVRALKQTILEQAAGTSNGLKATDQQRKAIGEAVNGLTTRNPTKDVATSELATGMWNLLYTTTPGASGGKLGPFIGDVQQEVDIADGLYVNYVRLGPLTGKLDATWEVINKQQWKVVFKTIAFLLWGREVVKKDLGQEGLWTLSYLDDDMRILAARSLERDTGNLYILTRA